MGKWELHAVTRAAWSRAVRGWRVISPEYTNVVLDSVSFIAITRGVLYGFGPTPRDFIPRGLDLLPGWMLYIYGVMWLFAGLFGVYTARGHQDHRQHWAQRFITALCLVWAICYFAGGFFPTPGSTETQTKSSLVAGVFWLVVARIAAHADMKRSFRTLFIVRKLDSKKTGPTFLVTKQDSDIRAVDNGEGR